MKVLKHGKYHKKAMIVCRHCGCEFEIEYGECMRKSSTYTEYVWAECPECGESIILDEQDFQTELYEKEK